MQITDYDPDDDLTDAQYDDWREELQRAYRFHLLNPAYTNGVQYSLWISPPEVEGEYSVLTHSRGHITVLNSRHAEIGDPIPITDECWDVLAEYVHQAVCHAPELELGMGRETVYVRDRLDRHYEQWLVHQLARQLILAEECVPELWPIVRWAQSHTGMAVPAYKRGVEDE